MSLSYQERSAKLRYVSEALGYDHPLTLLQTYINEAIVPGVCVTLGCHFINGVERTEERGHCVNCHADTVQSVMVLAGVA